MTEFVMIAQMILVLPLICDPIFLGELSASLPLLLLSQEICKIEGKQALDL